ncbi:MAG: glucose-1-phosphate cytidylyltransferase [Coriobacteriia bacterium]
MKPQVVILCGGKGTRLREETGIKPKPMVEIGGKPILWHIMKSYSAHGFDRFVLALGYRGDVIKSYFYHYRVTASDFTVKLSPHSEPRIHSVSDEERWEITCVDTGEETLKGGRVKRLESFLEGDRFHLTYGDGVGDVDITALDEYHRSHGRLGTVTAVRPPSRFGEMRLDGDRVVSFEEKPQMGTGLINGGFFVLDRSFLDRLTPDEDCDLEFGALQTLAADDQLRVWRHDGFWQCMDTARERDALEKAWRAGEAPWKVWA